MPMVLRRSQGGGRFLNLQGAFTLISEILLYRCEHVRDTLVKPRPLGKFRDTLDSGYPFDEAAQGKGEIERIDEHDR